jgi:hypothetical protein
MLESLRLSRLKAQGLAAESGPLINGRTFVDHNSYVDDDDIADHGALVEYPTLGGSATLSDAPKRNVR